MEAFDNGFRTRLYRKVRPGLEPVIEHYRGPDAGVSSTLVAGPSSSTPMADSTLQPSPSSLGDNNSIQYVRHNTDAGPISNYYSFKNINSNRYTIFVIRSETNNDKTVHTIATDISPEHERYREPAGYGKPECGVGFHCFSKCEFYCSAVQPC
ncbi:hypothetical protein Bbelb_363030 [Branchiostoma belcheri]|nr:hypothetical protein Bbelb_363030 [Branchiostoma belcheri]